MFAKKDVKDFLDRFEAKKISLSVALNAIQTPCITERFRRAEDQRNELLAAA